MPTYPDLTPGIARRALCQAGFSYAAEALTIDAREERWVVSLPDGRIAWFPASPAGARRLAVETKPEFDTQRTSGARNVRPDKPPSRPPEPAGAGAMAI
jgi:hypothetical protein